MRYRFHTADVFTDRIFGGNPVAVFPEAEGIGEAQMQRIAREFNLSETVFVTAPEDPAHTRKLRIFTPVAELPFAGHPTVGTAHILAATGRVGLDGAETRITFEEGVGPVPVTIRARDGRPVFAQLSAAKLPEFGPPPPSDAEIAALLSLSPADLAPDMRPRAVSCGIPYLFVALGGRDAVARARLDRAAWERTLAGHWAPSLCLLTLETETPGSDVHARVFGPALGVDEDPATGSAAAALAGYLGAAETGAGPLAWRVEQGLEMGRPSFLEVEADKEDGAIRAVRVGGASVLVSEGEMEVPAA